MMKSYPEQDWTPHIPYLTYRNAQHYKFIVIPFASAYGVQITW